MKFETKEQLSENILKINKTPFSWYTSGEKSAKSIIEKVEKNSKIKCFGDIKDLIRATIVVDSYVRVPALIENMRKFELIANLHGDISRTSSGYKGVHLNGMFKGCRFEIQVSTLDVLWQKIIDDVRYHEKKDEEYEYGKLESPSLLDRRKHSIAIAKFAEQEVAARQDFAKAYRESRFTTAVLDIEPALQLLTANAQKYFTYQIPILNRYSKSIEEAEKVIPVTSELQVGLQSHLLKNLETVNLNIEMDLDTQVKITKIKRINDEFNQLLQCVLQNESQDRFYQIIKKTNDAMNSEVYKYITDSQLHDSWDRDRSEYLENLEQKIIRINSEEKR